MNNSKTLTAEQVNAIVKMLTGKEPENKTGRYDLHIDLPNDNHLVVKIDLDNPDSEQVLQGAVSNFEGGYKLNRHDMRIYHESEFAINENN